MRRSLLLLALAGCTHSPRAASAPTSAGRYSLDAIRFGTLANFPVRGLVAGADSARRMDVAVMVWALRNGSGKSVLVDAGFHREKFLTQWKPRDFVLPSEAVRQAGIDPNDVSDIIISHIHWDHADGVDLFPNARVWLQREEFNYYVGANGEALKPAIDPDVSAMFRRLFADGRVRLVDGNNREILPGIRVYTGGKHTWASQFVGVQLTGGGTAVVASDNAYLYENLRGHRPIAQTLDSLSNLRAQAQMMSIASDPRLVVPGHDPLLFTTFPTPGNGVAHIH
ncbi:MAG: N-acyl homoserine lactonase family protein [Gemmatimonadaceae bacterium]